MNELIWNELELDWIGLTGELTTATMPVGLIEGTETMIFFTMFIGCTWMLFELYVIFGGLVWANVIHRLVWAHNHLK